MWQVIEDALAHRRPRRTATWLADQLGVSIAVVSNWKSRGRIPADRYRAIANALGLTLDQLEGLEPPPWAAGDEGEWPFSSELRNKVLALSEEERRALEHVVTGILELRQKSLSSVLHSRKLIHGKPTPDVYPARQEEVSGLPAGIDIPEPHEDDSSTENSRRSHPKGRRGA